MVRKITILIFLYFNILIQGCASSSDIQRLERNANHSESKLLRNDRGLTNEIQRLSRQFSRISDEANQNNEETQRRLEQLVEGIQQIKEKTDLIHVQGNRAMSIIESNNGNTSIRLNPQGGDESYNSEELF